MRSLLLRRLDVQVSGWLGSDIGRGGPWVIPEGCGPTAMQEPGGRVLPNNRKGQPHRNLAWEWGPIEPGRSDGYLGYVGE